MASNLDYVLVFDCNPTGPRQGENVFPSSSLASKNSTSCFLNCFFQELALYHIAQDNVSTSVKRAAAERTTGRRSVSGRGGAIAMMYERHWAQIV